MPRPRDPNKPASLTEPLYLRIKPHLKQRLLAQCDRLHCSQAALVDMALVKFLEEEEKIQAVNQQR